MASRDPRLELARRLAAVLALRPSEIVGLDIEPLLKWDWSGHGMMASQISVHGAEIYLPPEIGDEIFCYIFSYRGRVQGPLFGAHNGGRRMTKKALLALDRKHRHPGDLDFPGLRRQAILDFAKVAPLRLVQKMARIKDRAYLKRLLRSEHENRPSQVKGKTGP